VTELGELRRHYQEILERGVEVAAVSVDPPEVSEKLRQKLGVGIRFLSDERGMLMDALDVRDRDGLPPDFITGGLGKGRESRDIFLATTFLVDEGGVIRWLYRPDTYRVRAPASEVLQAIDALGRPERQRASAST